MRPGTREETMTVEEVVRAAAHVVDPEQRAEGVAALLLAFEDDDRPATAAEALDGELRSTAERIDPDGVEPPVAATAAAAYWLATNPGDADDPQRTIREGCRLFFGDAEPAAVAEWLAERGLA